MARHFVVYNKRFHDINQWSEICSLHLPILYVCINIYIYIHIDLQTYMYSTVCLYSAIHRYSNHATWNWECASKEKYYYLVYMTKGGLTSRDESMLLDVKDHFQQRLDERGVLMDWLWLDAWNTSNKRRVWVKSRRIFSWILLESLNAWMVLLGIFTQQMKETNLILFRE